MSYYPHKPFGRRKTDKPLSAEDRRELQMIRQDVDEDASGLIRRYLRLAAKVLTEPDEATNAEQSEKLPDHAPRKNAA